AAGYDIPVMPHSPKVGAEAAAVLQFASIVPNLGPHQEYHGAANPIEPWYEPGFQINNGAVMVPPGPGLGVSYDPAIWSTAIVLASSS
ncbi:MAG: enolase C-terminal domain-like protein, partial [Anaerolineae bacterium]|nr:enolase C-terminal domain-like protein [Anaerolineae bacterium]